MLPIVTVLMSAYNSAAFVSESVESILGQTYRNLELLVIDDGSTDRTSSILAEYSKRDDRVRILTNRKNIGLVQSLNIGLAKAKGMLIARMDADDISHPSRIALQTHALLNQPSSVYVTTDVGILDENGHEVSSGPRPGFECLCHWYNHFYNYVGGHGLGMYRRDAVIDCGAYRNVRWARYCEDYELWTRLIKTPGSVIFIPEKLLLYRRHPSAIGIQYAKEQLKSVLKTASRMQSSLLRRSVPLQNVRDAYYYWTEPQTRPQLWPRVGEYLETMLNVYLNRHGQAELRTNIERHVRGEFNSVISGSMTRSKVEEK